MAVPIACQRGPACAVVDARADGAPPCGSARKSLISRATGSPARWVCRRTRCMGSGSRAQAPYGRNDAGDAGIDTALLSKTVGRPGAASG